MAPPINRVPGSGFGAPGRPRHGGIDFPAAVGTEVDASATGTVVKIGDNDSGGYGNVVVIDHGVNELGEHVYTLYAHLSGFDPNIAVGREIQEGQQLGKSGGQPGDSGAGSSTGA